MNAQKTDLSSVLLAQLPAGTDLPKLHANALAAMQNEKMRLNRQRIAAQLFWIFCAVMATAYMWFGPQSEHAPRAPFLACLFLLWGGIELLKHRIESSRVQTMAEVKQLQLQVLELTIKLAGTK